MNRKKTPKLSLEDAYHEIAKQWHPIKNLPLFPSDVGAQSNKKFWWICSKGHEWEAICSNRTRKNQGCPFCSNKMITTENCLLATHPDIAAEWHPTKNESLKSTNIIAGSHKRIWWQCNNGHEWQSVCNTRTGKNKHGCPFCSGHKVTNLTSLLATYPRLVKEWHPTKNFSLTPADVKAGGKRKVWWLCAAGHEWEATLYNRSGKNSRGCPYCSNKKVSVSNSLEAVFPDIAKELHSAKNGFIKASDLVAGSGKKLWWICRNKHEYEAACNKRTGKEKTGCPYCKSGWTIEKIRLFVRSLLPYLDTLNPADLYVLFQQQEGLLNIQGKGKSFVQMLKTGKFPKNELEKFIDGKPSLVDMFVLDQMTSLKSKANDELLSEITENMESHLSYNHDLPTVETKDVFTLLESPFLSSNADVETIDFFIKSGCAKIWHHMFSNSGEANLQLEQYQGNNEYAQQVKQLFQKEYNGAKKLNIPKGYSFSKQPNLMQRHVAYLIKTRKRIGNWSGTGAGKTLSAILASRVIFAGITVICCPNNVIDNWKLHIQASYPDSFIYTKESVLQLRNINNKHQYLILNYEFFQQPGSEKKLKELLLNCNIDFIIIDEIHYSKQRKPESSSKRKKLLSTFLSEAANKNLNLHVLGMTATPVINELFEGKTLIELVTGIHHDDLDTRRTVSNCIDLYKKFISYGVRYIPNYKQQLNIIEERIDCGALMPEIKNHRTSVELDAILTKAKIPYILEQIRPKTMIYTHYREGIELQLQEVIIEKGWKVALFNGDTKEGLKAFIKGNADVLIASSCIGTGVDGLQYVCNRLIINCLPWTHAEFKQLMGRIYRQGQESNYVDIIIPLTFATMNGERKSWCEYRWERIKSKKTIADAAVDGTIPEGHFKMPEQAHKDIMQWLNRLDAGKVNNIERQKINLQFEENIQINTQKTLSDLTKMNQQINKETSVQTHKRFANNPLQWYEYHEAYTEARKDWDIIPYQEAIKWCQARPLLVIGDFGCGEALLANELENKVYSFDHVAINDNVIACDISNLPLDDLTLDAAIFSLSLMGTNFVDYLREAHRCLKLDGHLWIAEPTSRITDINIIKELFERLGFDIRCYYEKSKFTFIEGIKSERDVNVVALQNLIDKNILR